MNNDSQGPLGPIEYSSEVTESTTNHGFANEQPNALVPAKERLALSVFGLVLSIPFPVLIVVLWLTLNVIKEQNQALGEGTMNAVFLYLLQFFVVPVLTVSSLIIAFMVTLKSGRIAKKLGYVSFGITTLGFMILGVFLNTQ